MDDSGSITEAAAVLRSDSGGIATLTLNRAAQFNPLSEQMMAALQAALEAIAKDGAVRVVVLAAEGRAFCAGHDLKQMRARPELDYYQTLFKQCSKLMLTIQQLPQPVIARVQGIATAAGCQLVAMCDLAVASSTARFAVSGINFGLFCATPSVALSRNVARKQAMEMLLTGEMVSAEEACRIGLVNRVVKSGKAREEALALAAKIVRKSAAIVKLGKEAFYRQMEMNLAEAYAYAAEVMVINMMTRDAGEGISAFVEKRTPKWEDR